MTKPDPTIRYQAEMDQYWAQITALIERDPKGTMKMIDALRKVAQGEAIPQLALDSPEMRQVAWFAVAALSEGVYRVEKRKQEE